MTGSLAAPGPEAPSPRHGRKLEKLESLAMLDHAFELDHVPSSTTAITIKSPARGYASSLVLSLSLQRGRVVGVTAFVMVVIVTLTLVFHQGVQLDKIDAKTHTEAQKSQLLDDYNSYSGNIASVFGKPVEIFVTMAVQLVVLLVVGASSVSRSAESRQGWGGFAGLVVVPLLLSIVVGYMVNNAFNAVNVQLRALEIEPVISNGDLSVAVRNASNLTSSVASDVSEETKGNPITNTLLRNLVLPREPKAKTQCNWAYNQDQAFAAVPDIVLEYGFAQRDWHSDLLQHAIEPTSHLSIVVNATSKPKTTPQASDLPMDASRAANLFLYAMFFTLKYLPWGLSTQFANITDITRRYPMTASSPDQYVNTAELAGLLPSAEADETTQREWFLRESAAAVSRQFSTSRNTSQSDIVMNFTHVAISPSISFDSITLTAEMNPRLFGGVTLANKTRYTTLDQLYECSVWPARCMIKKPIYTMDSSLFDAPVQIQSVAMCLADNGSETLVSKLSSSVNAFPDSFQCSKGSNRSMLIFSIAKHVEADALLQNLTWNATTESLQVDAKSAVAVNLRKFYTLTIARLGWELQDLSSDFNAKCDSDVPSCLGLHLPLEASASSDSSQPQQRQLVVGEESLPLDQLPLPNRIVDIKPQLLPLVKLHETQRFLVQASAPYDTVAGDVLLPSNIGRIVWDPVVSAAQNNLDDCDALVEERMGLVLNNHLYMQTSLQQMYTAATFFLFQNAAVKDVVSLNQGRQSLDFDGNVEQLAVWVSIPKLNTWLTLGGCILLTMSLLVGVAWTTRAGGSLRQLTEPQMIARAIMDEVRFPPLFLHRRVLHGNELTGQIPRPVDGFEVESLTLHHRHDREGCDCHLTASS